MSTKNILRISAVYIHIDEQSIGRLSLEVKELGFGSFGTIYLAKHKTLDFKFAAGELITALEMLFISSFWARVEVKKVSKDQNDDRVPLGCLLKGLFAVCSVRNELLMNEIHALMDLDHPHVAARR